jgi:alanine-glyoxylate transaminase/serine-glyoxylate transaminase/serine-pyruvate transaminase
MAKGAIKAVMLIQNETATGIRHPVAEVRAVMNRLGHPAMYLVDTISSLALVRLPMDEWGVDLVIGGSQKGLMLPPGMAFTAINAARGRRARRATRAATGTGARWSKTAARCSSAARRRSRTSTASKRRST